MPNVAILPRVIVLYPSGQRILCGRGAIPTGRVGNNGVGDTDPRANDWSANEPVLTGALNGFIRTYSKKVKNNGILSEAENNLMFFEASVQHYTPKIPVANHFALSMILRTKQSFFTYL
ncbi:MAG: hypothetical protein FWH15_02150 [Betaproteobacteria bacterium]|nr:hypothetical protein [Betaproteobacteria bacterium]